VTNTLQEKKSKKILIRFFFFFLFEKWDASPSVPIFFQTNKHSNKHSNTQTLKQTVCIPRPTPPRHRPLPSSLLLRHTPCIFSCIFPLRVLENKNKRNTNKRTKRKQTPQGPTLLMKRTSSFRVRLLSQFSASSVVRSSWACRFLMTTSAVRTWRRRGLSPPFPRPSQPCGGWQRSGHLRREAEFYPLRASQPPLLRAES